MTIAEMPTVSVEIDGELANIPGIDREMATIARQLSSWVEDSRSNRGGSLFTRDKYTATDRIFDQIRIARQALHDDDIVSGIAELTEGLAFQGVQWESGDPDTSDLFNQMAAEQNLDGLIRKIWREEFALSTCTLAYWWDWGEFQIRGETDKGNKRKTMKRVWFPRLVTVLDPERIVPVGLLAFGQERLAWRATSQEMAAFQQYLIGEYEDDLFDRFYVDRYQVSDRDELLALTRVGVDTQNLILLNEDCVSRHTLTKPDYDRFATVRLKSIFRLLDMKQQLLEADRVSLVGAANYILLVKKGDKDNPAHPEEITNLKANYHTLAKVPVIFSDHRLSVEIVTPNQDFTLSKPKYDILDSRITTRLLSSIASTSSGRSGDAGVLMGRPVARAMEGRRHMIRRYVERNIAKAVIEHPNNEGIFLEGAPSLSYSPPNIVIDEDFGFAQSILALRTQKELSRESTLEYFGFDQEVEAMRRQLEEKKFDDIFKTEIPFSASSGDGQTGRPPADQGGAGAQGGRPAGGGTPSQNPAKPTARTPSGNTKPAKAGN